jgi:phosphatidylethanolamine/phosphatidyl-N-methylethanolamine N-methyltransferase
MFDSATRLVGVDLSEPMLRRAANRVRRDKLGNVEGLVVMDAMRLAFDDACFDAVVAPYVLTVVPDPGATLDELLRVVKPGGEIVLVNHVGAERGLLAAVEAWIAPGSSNAAPSRRSACLPLHASCGPADRRTSLSCS